MIPGGTRWPRPQILGRFDSASEWWIPPELPQSWTADYSAMLEGLGTERWADLVVDVAAAGEHVASKGAGPGSLESDDTAGLDYRVTISKVVEEELPWFTDAIDAIITTECSRMALPLLRRHRDERQGLNLNYHNVPVGDQAAITGNRYELHEDLVGCWVMVVFVTKQEGGELAVYKDGHPGVQTPIRTYPGLVAFMRRETPHEVLPIRSGTRVSVPVTLVPAGDEHKPLVPYGGRDNLQMDADAYRDFLFGSENR